MLHWTRRALADPAHAAPNWPGPRRSLALVARLEALASASSDRRTRAAGQRHRPQHGACDARRRARLARRATRCRCRGDRRRRLRCVASGASRDACGPHRLRLVASQRASAAGRGRQRRPRARRPALDHVPGRRRPFRARSSRRAARRRARCPARGRHHVVREGRASATDTSSGSASRSRSPSSTSAISSIFRGDFQARAGRSTAAASTSRSRSSRTGTSCCSSRNAPRFSFVPLGSFRWHAERGDSGAGAGANHDPVQVRGATRPRLREMGGCAATRSCRRTQPLLEQAAQLAQAGRLADADALCDQVLAISVNDPWALNLRAMLLRRGGRLDRRASGAGARGRREAERRRLRLQSRAARPGGRGSRRGAPSCATRPASWRPDFAPAHALVAEPWLSVSRDSRELPCQPSTDSDSRWPTRSMPSPAASPRSSTPPPPA